MKQYYPILAILAVLLLAGIFLLQLEERAERHAMQAALAKQVSAAAQALMPVPVVPDPEVAEVGRMVKVLVVDWDGSDDNAGWVDVDNQSSRSIKDLVFVLHEFGGSGMEISALTATSYTVVKSGGITKVRIHMGYGNGQRVTKKLELVSFTVMK